MMHGQQNVKLSKAKLLQQSGGTG